ncbi:MAG: FAD-dependent oxidoreductase [Candidatus Gastranaerophilales bacterium]
MGTVIKNIILGSGIAGISAGHHLQLKGEDVVLYEKNSDWGGLCGNFMIDGFRFDKFVHFTFAEDEYIKNKFEESSPIFRHPSISSNYYNGYWLKHPAQNNLSPLKVDEKVKIITDFINREQKNIDEIENYEQWLRVQYGDYFAENFPFKYTRKYWGVEASELETKWVGNRMHSPDLSQVLAGAFEEQKEIFYYTKHMGYPKKGGFRSILNSSRDGLDIEFNKEVVKIDTTQKILTFKDGSVTNYDNLISTLPLPEIVQMLENVPKEVVQASKKLKWTSGYMVSLGFNRTDVAKHLWFYIYDEDILASRVYSPSLKSVDNVPEGCSSLQAEIFFANDSEILDKQMVLDNTLDKLKDMGIFKDENLVVKDIRFEKYANIIFTPEIYKNREIVLDYLNNIKIRSIGRFGKWDYLWTHQVYERGRWK